MHLFVKHLGHEIGFKTIKTIRSKKVANHEKFSTTKIELMSFIGSMKFYSKFFDKLRVNMKTLSDLLHDNNKFHWNDGLETLFQQIESSLTKDVTLTLPNTNLSFFITVDFLYMV